ncbi:MAG: sensor histidine kinase [Anaeroplasma sp.]
MKKNWFLLSIIFMLFLCFLAIFLRCNNSIQSSNSITPKVIFEGDYIIEGEERKPIDYEKLPITTKDVTLIGKFIIVFPNDEYRVYLQNGDMILLYFNHIEAQLFIDGQEAHMFDTENQMFNEYSCGKMFISYVYTGEEGEKVTIELKNHHFYGNSLAVKEFLNSMYMYNPVTLENKLVKEGAMDRTIGTIIMIISLAFIGVSFFSFAIHFSKSKLILLIGLLLFFGSGYYILDSPNIYFWNSNVMFNTTGLYFCIILYVFFMFCLVSYFLPIKENKIAKYIVALDFGLTLFLIILSLIRIVYIYDTLFVFCIFTSIQSIILLILLCLGLKKVKRNIFIVFAVLIGALICLNLDFLATGLGWWEGGMLSKYVFLLISLAACALIFMIIPKNFLDVEHKKELEIELQKSQNSIMLSQIQPHFLYNTLASIRYLCKNNPKQAQEALDNFSMYLRGNMASIQEHGLIPFSRELSHIETYLNLEKISFGDKLNVVYNIEENNFSLPCLTIQPIVENAVKHGVCCTENGGTIIISSKRKGEKIIIEVTDDGVGFDTSILAISDNKNHIGIQNVSKRLAAMKCGSLEVESEVGKGTRVTIVLDMEKVGGC